MGEKADKAVDQIEGYDTYWGSGYNGEEAEKSLKALSELDSGELQAALEQLNDSDVTSMLVAASRHNGLDKNEKYSKIVDALGMRDPKIAVDPKKTQEANEKKPEFADGSGWELADEKDHLYRVDLYQPRGASEALASLIEDTEFTMQWGFDTLGARNPKAHPDFTNVLDSQQVTSADGWSQVRDKHDKLKGQLSDRQTEYADAHKNVDVNTEDSAILNSDTFKKLKKITEDLNDKLQFEFPSATVEDGKMIYRHKDVDNSPTQTVVYQKNKDSGKYYLTAEAEQQYYVRYIDAAAESWEKEYDNATKEFQKKADGVDKQNRNADDHSGSDGNNGNKGNGNANNGNNNANNNNNAGNSDNGNNNTYVPPTGNSTQQTGTTNDDWSSTYDDLIGGSTDTSASETGTGTQPISDTGSADTSSSGTDPAATQAGLQTGSGIGTGSGTTGTNTGANTGSVAPAASTGDNGMANAMQQMAMMSAMSGMMNQGNRQPDDDRAYAERDRERERERREERERNRNAQTATANQAVQQGAPPGVTAPTYAGSPPPITAPGTTPAVQIGNTTVQASPPVAEALQKQTQNVALDAISAYKGTAGEITAEHPPAVVNGPGDLKTGDILQWEKFSALVVRNPNGMDGLFVLDGGQLIPLDPNNPPLTEKYGNFTGFVHPTGLDVGSNTADPGATAPPPPTLSTAQPSGPPPVGPPPQV